MALRTLWFLKKGIAYKATKSTDSGFDLLKWLKRYLNFMNVPFHDDCCDNAQTTAPVRFNKTSGDLEYYQYTTDTWVAVPSTGLGA